MYWACVVSIGTRLCVGCTLWLMKSSGKWRLMGIPLLILKASPWWLLLLQYVNTNPGFIKPRRFLIIYTGNPSKTDTLQAKNGVCFPQQTKIYRYQLQLCGPPFFPQSFPLKRSSMFHYPPRWCRSLSNSITGRTSQTNLYKCSTYKIFGCLSM